MTVDRGAAPRVLILEDDFFLAEEVRNKVEEWGYVVVGAIGRGDAALQLAIEAHPDVLISDVRLRDAIDGVTVAEELHSRLGTRVIFVTAYPAEALASGLRFGAKFLGKPFSDSELRQALEESVAKR